ncbi:unnamed protein product [Meloidogyne enterolobii]|uniref:Uncharacterized protein n=1 Tax=Meloidogyne enterolobii TaxID=390850 RepID=A0ACB0YWD6_MELEN
MVNHNVQYLFNIILLIIISPLFGWEVYEPFAGSLSFYNELHFAFCVPKDTDAENDLLVAISDKQWRTDVNKPDDPLCHVCLKVDYNGKCITVPVRDVCFECSATHAKLSKPAFEKLESLAVGSV